MALIGEGGAGAHDLVDMIRRGGRMYWSSAASQVYAEPKRMERLGYLKSEKQPGRTKPRTVYRLTPKGRRALKKWLAEPSPFPRIQHEASVRLLAGDMIPDEKIVASLRGLRGEVDELSRLVDEMDAGAARVPHRERYLRLQHSLARRLLAAHRDWIDEVERELGFRSRTTSPGSPS
jgi:DNA-binding PadR family transcriptional regulator